jgi:hypothetical protein
MKDLKPKISRWVRRKRGSPGEGWRYSMYTIDGGRMEKEYQMWKKWSRIA